MFFFKKKKKEDEVYPVRFMRIKEEKDDEVYASGQYISLPVDKARRVIDQIRGRSYEETLMILELMSYRACYPIFKLIYSAAANASHNRGFNKADLIISKAEVNKGTTMKKLKPRARGRSYLIKRSTCHITIVLRDISYYAEYDRFLESLSIDDLIDLLCDLPKHKRYQLLSGRFMEKYKLKPFLEGLGLI
uniref:Large ribosomal subunit protein uL22c n=3 Tax=Achatocarpaceae TaxID=25636 RepID=A0A411K138_9CARY|nr:ribosomal protein L22 [Achatocarpus nigricans]YP_009557202.1 ribosomal protein L22 [Achatocarpus pubescens]QBC70969.1 ribosomal protein L22 [Achatocarpus nigricans]QBC71047.1 ribosomal protein L22 [Achatocarpus pubescens]QBE87766.1 ribosomal protein L22 [Phaulothamnus spinescens]